MGARTWLRRVLLLVALMAPGVARAEADSFGTGDGADGAKTAAAAGEVVNVYAAVANDVAAGATAIDVQAIVPSGTFAIGDLVFVWRATGVLDTEAASADQTALTLANAKGIENAAAGVVGRFEFAKVQNVAGGTLTLTAPLLNGWKKDVTQVVKVPRYTTVSVPNGTSLVAAPWQTSGTGLAGGILVFLAQGQITIADGGALDASNAGFRGGLKVTRGSLVLDCPNNDGTVEQGYAPKGEGVVSAKFGGSDNGGKGNRSIAAGGGNCVENGGGGGGNAGVGGRGGDSVLAGVLNPGGRGGLGGAAINYSLLQRMTFGGGGGAGEQKNGVGSSGGAGGGVIFVRAKSIANAGTISANGETALNAGLTALSESDGAGGGGAGGSILLRIVDDVTCTGTGAIQANGGAGGPSQVIGLSVWAPGGGGAGGRALVQAKTNACTPQTAAGAAGLSGGAVRGATAGGAGATEAPPKPGGYCFSNPTTNPQCAATVPVCDTTTGFCDKCNGAFGSGASAQCPTANAPVCNPDGSCTPCTRDFPDAPGGCQLSSTPTCVLTGADQGTCIKCTKNDDCIGHEGTLCNVPSGACGIACQKDSDCNNVQWCALGVCIPKTPNGEHVPNIDPVNGNCTPENGKRVCISAVCEEDDDLCGKRNGDPCAGALECRSEVCFSDGACGLPSGEPCSGDEKCRSARCENGVCAGCNTDNDCGFGRICDQGSKQCVGGCRVVNGKDNCKPPEKCSKQDGTIGQCVNPSSEDGGVNDGGVPAVDDTGIVEGGGCSCRTSTLAASPPIAIGAILAAALLFVRRRKNSNRG
jgi:MYXO-CTERM domain-containing protein